MIGTAVINHYITRMIDVLQTNKSIIQINNSLLNRILKRMLALIFSPSIKKRRNSGDSLIFLTRDNLPDDLYWAKSHPVICRAFASFAVAANAAGESTLTLEARTTVQHYIEDWDGKEPGISRNWAEQAVKPLTGPSKIAAKLALLTAVSPYQIDDDLIRDFRTVYKEDLQLLNVLSWSSFTAARKIGSWLSIPYT
ncbi:hypothetical protein [Paenibacillus humicola]|uniref:hypothetical protein n=1 Tax=Paenibacillus humicola TaxID=3110540 RepID=UPI00237A2B95|nr:hypothetical protein [Paenibacillus humicola]